MTNFELAIASGPMQPFSISISVPETRQIMMVHEVTLMIEQKFSGGVPPVVALESGIGVMPKVIELASAAVVLLALIGFILAVVAPGTLTGLILPVALVAWWLLYREIKRRGL